MIFAFVWDFAYIGVFLGIQAFLIWVFFRSTRQRNWLKNALRVTSTISFLIVTLFAALMVSCDITQPRPSDLIYSPDRSHAARIYLADEGATGGETWVKMFSMYGLRSSFVYGGEWMSISRADLHWNDNTALTITYHQGSPPELCSGAQGIKVNCEPAP